VPPLLSLAPDPGPEFENPDSLPYAFTTLEDIAEDTASGPSASLIYVEGQLALYLDEEDTDLALQQVDDRDIAIMHSLVTLAAQKLNREVSRRNVAANVAASANYSTPAGW
jgi:hypothetical protein